MSSFYSFSQKINFPSFENRDSKQITINAIETTRDWTILDMEYMCPYKYNSDSTYFNFDPATILFTNSKIYKLIGTEKINTKQNINWCTQKGLINKFKLIFEKLDDTVKTFHLIECQKKTTCFNFYGIDNKTNNKEHSDGVLFSTKIKDDIFLSYLDPIIQKFFEKEVFVYANMNFNDYFNNLIEKKYENDSYLNQLYESIEVESRGDRNVYTISPKIDSKILMELYISKSKTESNRFSTSVFYFKNDIDMEKFFKSFCEYNGYTYDYSESKKSGLRIFSYWQIKKEFFSNIVVDKNFGIPRIIIDVLPDNEYYELIKNMKKTK